MKTMSSEMRRSGRGSRGRGGKRATGEAARGGVRTTGQGVRTRGGGRGGRGGEARVTQQRPHTFHDIYIGLLKDQPQESSIETPLHPKRRRTREFDDYSSVDRSSVPSTSFSATSATSAQEAVSSPQPFVSPAATATPEHSVQSPALFVKCCVSPQQGTPKGPVSSSSAQSHHPLQEQEIGEVLNEGSEEDEPPSDDDETGAVLIPRSALVFLKPKQDTQQEAVVAGRIDECLSNGSDEIEGPKGLFEFQWTSFPERPLSPLLRREAFVGNAGPTIADGPISNPYNIFVKIWDRAIMERIAGETNRYAQQYATRLLERGEIGPRSRISCWKDTDVDELYVYFALVIAMGIVIKSKLEDYWNRSENIFVTPGFSVQMSLRRFQLLSRCLHFVDNTTNCDAQSRAEAKVSKIKPVIDHLNVKFQQLYRLGQNIALDESLMQWKGLSNIKQYISHKAAEEGIKTYEVCDSRTGYLWRFEVHGGSEIDSREQVVIPGQIPNLVLRLLRGLENRGHTVWMDNFYNSPALARVLKTRGFDCVGTLRTNRQFVPQEITTLKTTNMEVDAVCGATAGDVDIIVWCDQNQVAMISTYHGVAVSEGKPTVVQDYNICMGGVDKKDQLLSTYPMERKRTLIWYKKFFRRLLNVSVLNAYIIFKTYQTTTHRDFRVKLVTSILQNCGLQREVTVSMKKGKFNPDVIAHFPMQLPHIGGSSKAARLRRLCVVCKLKRTHVICKACNVALCYDFEELSCYMKYHS